MEHIEALESDLDDTDTIVVGAPTYMGSLSTSFKMFAEATSKAWRAGAAEQDRGGLHHKICSPGPYGCRRTELQLRDGRLSQVWLT
jgi:multimeric flavodoxin WrbA